MKKPMTPEERDELLAAKIYAALVGLTVIVAGAAIVIYYLIK